MRVRNVLLRLLAAVLAAAALVFPGFGVPDLLVTWDPAWQVVLEAGWGVFMTVLVAVPLLTIAVAPGRAGPALAQLWVCVGCVLAASVLAADPPATVLGLGLAACTGLVTLLGGKRPSSWRGAPDAPLLVVALLGAVPWLGYAVAEARADRQHLDGADITVGVDHHALQAALALALVVLPLLAAVRGPGRRYLTTCVAAAASYLAVVALAHPSTPGGIGRTWSPLALGWCVALLLAGWAAERRFRTTAPTPG